MTQLSTERFSNWRDCLRVEGGGYRIITKGANDALNASKWKEREIYYPKYNWKPPNLVMTGKVDESTILKRRGGVKAYMQNRIPTHFYCWTPGMLVVASVKQWKDFFLKNLKIMGIPTDTDIWSHIKETCRYDWMLYSEAQFYKPHPCTQIL